MTNKIVLSKGDVDNIKKSLHESICKVIFTKANGEKRVMHCTLNPDMIPQEPNTSETKRTKKENEDVQPVYDLEAQGWRSFRWDSLIEFSSGMNA